MDSNAAAQARLTLRAELLVREDSSLADVKLTWGSGTREASFVLGPVEAEIAAIVAERLDRPWLARDESQFPPADGVPLGEIPRPGRKPFRAAGTDASGLAMDVVVAGPAFEVTLEDTGALDEAGFAEFWAALGTVTRLAARARAGRA